VYGLEHQELLTRQATDFQKMFTSKGRFFNEKQERGVKGVSDDQAMPPDLSVVNYALPQRITERMFKIY